MKRLRVIGILVLLATVLSIYGGTSASASTPTPGATVAVYKVSHTFTMHRATETCIGYHAIGKSSAYPGYVATYAWVLECTPSPAEFCSQTGDLQIQNINTGVWNHDGTGPTTYGCDGPANVSTRTWPCRSTNITLGYRTQGIFVVIDAAGATLSWSGYSPKESVLRIC
jgi:hypothetical protein